jgi:hypothetical protein
MPNTIDAFGVQISGDLASVLITVPMIAVYVLALSWVFKNELGRHGGDSGSSSDHASDSGSDGSGRGEVK